jgi:hypothetical protein
MKYFTLFTLFFFPFSFCFSQLSWVEDLDLPESGEKFNIKDCSFLDNNDFGIESQILSNDTLLHTTTDSIILDSSGECEKVIRELTLLNWWTGEVYILELIFIVDPNQGSCPATIALEDNNQSEVTVHIEDILGVGASPDFSFSLSDPDLDTMSLSTSQIHNLILLNHATNELCAVELEFNFCPSGYNFEIVDEITVDMSQEKCVSYDVMDVITEFEYNCGSYDLGFLVEDEIQSEITIGYRGQNFSNQKKIFLITENQDTVIKNIVFHLESPPEPPYVITLAGDDFYQAGDTAMIQIGGEEVENLLFFAGHFGYNGIKGLSVSDIHPVLQNSNRMEYNFADTYLRFSLTGGVISTPKDIPGNEPWFTFHFVVEEDGKVSDLIDFTPFFLDEIGFSGEGCESFFIAPVVYEFSDNLILSENQATSINSVKMYPQPASDYLLVEGWKGKSAQMNILAMDGRRILSESFSTVGGPLKIATSTLSPGTYILQLMDEKSNKFVNKLFVVAR